MDAQSLTIRREQPGDADAITRINELAFGQPAEAKLVSELRAHGKIILSLVAEENRGRALIGHILFSPVTIDTSGGQVTAAGLAPMAVLPDHQRGGIGSRLVREGLAELQRLGHEAVVVLGHPTYYPRFGFQRASGFGLRCTFDSPDESFMAMELRPGALAGRAGLVRYLPEFDVF